ncbi:MAG: AAA domain-containing protein [Saprospiraceae bacterium]
MELDADRKRFRTEIQALPLKERVRRGFTWTPVQVVKSGFMVGERAYVVLERAQGRRRDSSLKSGSPVRYYTTVAGVERPEVSGVVHWIKDTQMQVVLSGRQIPSWSDINGQAVDLEFDENSYKEMRIALERAKFSKGRHKELTYILTGEQYPTYRPTERLLTPVSEVGKLNTSQRDALKLIAAAEDLAIIHGPPGTGKTTTLVSAIQRICQKERQVLVCAPSNTAVDLLAERLHQVGLRVVRTGHISRVSENLLDLTLDQQVNEHPDHKQIRKIKLEAAQIRKQASTFKRSFTRNDRKERSHAFKQAGELDGWARTLESRILGEVLDAAQVVCCTLTGAGAQFMRDRTFSTLVVDEAAQALEPAMWIPLQRAKRLIMAGDPFQLPPTVKSNEAQRAGLGVTMMERLLPLFTQASTLLSVQYRMHAAIMGFSNDYFYGGKLEAHESNEARGLDIEDEPAVRFIDTAGTGFDEQKNPETNSRFNPDEFLLLTTYLYGYRHQFSLAPPTVIEEDRPPEAIPAILPTWPTIALISPYREQVEQMRNEIKEDPLLSKLDIVVHTIDGFQGQERDWVILSLVRSNPNSEIGFLKDYRRMNVAMTRARKQLVVIGDSATIGADPFYGAFLDYVDANGHYASAFEYMQST